MIRPQDRRWPDRIAFGFLAARVALFAAGLIAAGIPVHLAASPNSADPKARASRTQYRPVIENYIPFRPVEPRSWTGVNQEVAPKPKPKSGDQRQR